MLQLPDADCVRGSGNVMLHWPDLACVAKSLFGRRSSAGRWLYLVALAVPAAIVVFQSLTSNWAPEFWWYAAVSLVCIWQFSCPTLSGWAVLVAAYAWIAFDAVINVLGDFQDIGTGDHGRWEGWPAEWKVLALTIFMVVLTVLVARRVPRKLECAT